MILRPVCAGGSSGTSLLGRFRWNKDLVGVKDGMNVIFKTPEIFVQSGEVVIRVFRNGQRLRFGGIDDFVIDESGGVGTGYDTVILSGQGPLSSEALTADYLTP